MRLPTKLSRHLRRFARQEDGAMALAMAGLLPLMFFSLTLVEASRVYGVKTQLQATADAAAMASVWHVPSGPVTATAEDYANWNLPANGVLDNVEMGYWDGADFFDSPPPGAQDNAVQVTTSGDMKLFFAAALRSLGVGAPGSLKPEAQAVALVRLDKCYENGFVAGGVVQMNSQNIFEAGYCVYGRGGVKMNNSNEFAAGTGVGMMDLNDLVAGNNNPGLEEALVQKNLSAPPLGRADELIEDFLAGGDSLIPDYITSTWTSSAEPPPTPVSGKMYLYDGTEPIVLNGDFSNIAIISRGPITIESNSNLTSVLLASSASIDIKSNVEIGNYDYCDTGEGASLVISGGAVTDKKDVSVGTNSNISLHGVQILAEGTMEMNSNLVITGASVQATENIVFNSSFDVTGCPDESPNVTGGGTKVAQLVD